jgi:hypothetical protein
LKQQGFPHYPQSFPQANLRYSPIKNLSEIKIMICEFLQKLFFFKKDLTRKKLAVANFGYKKPLLAQNMALLWGK